METIILEKELPGGYLLSTNPVYMKPEQIWNYLSEQSYWAPHISRERVETALQNSFCIGIFQQDQQVAFARLITDFATFAYLADVYVLPEHRGNGLSKIMMDTLMQLEWMQNLRRIQLVTRDAHTLYAQFGFSELEFPGRHMELTRKGLYTELKNKGLS